MLYCIYAKDRPDSLETRLKTRPQHLERIRELVEAGRLIIAGPLPAEDTTTPGAAGFKGSLIVAEFETLEAAKQWAETDPYTVAGVFESVEVSPFNKVLP